MLTYYISKYGLVIGFGICTVISILIIKIYLDLKSCEFEEVMIGTICAGIIAVQLVLNIFVNFRLLPFASHSTFLPFFSQGFGENLFVYILMGMLLSVYRYNPESYPKDCIKKNQ